MSARKLEVQVPVQKQLTQGQDASNLKAAEGQRVKLCVKTLKRGKSNTLAVHYRRLADVARLPDWL